MSTYAPPKPLQIIQDNCHETADVILPHIAPECTYETWPVHGTSILLPNPNRSFPNTLLTSDYGNGLTHGTAVSANERRAIVVAVPSYWLFPDEIAIVFLDDPQNYGVRIARKCITNETPKTPRRSS